MWCWGFFSPQLVQKIAQRVKWDVERALAEEEQAQQILNDIDALASIGSYGKYLGNCHRDLERHLEQPKMSLQSVKMPLKVLSSAVHQTSAFFEQAILLPHELFSAIGTHYARAWEKLVCPSRDRLQEFWHNVSHSPQLAGKYVFKFASAEYRQKICLHPSILFCGL